MLDYVTPSGDRIIIRSELKNSCVTYIQEEDVEDSLSFLERGSISSRKVPVDDEMLDELLELLLYIKNKKQTSIG
jgi:hypothetical protein